MNGRGIAQCTCECNLFYLTSKIEIYGPKFDIAPFIEYAVCTYCGEQWEVKSHGLEPLDGQIRATFAYMNELSQDKHIGCVSTTYKASVLDMMVNS